MKNAKVNAQQIITNIYTLAKTRNIKIGDLEKVADVSAGYLSRLNKEGNKTMPSIEILYAIAKHLGVTVDVLISSDISGMTKGERYVVNFIEKVTQDTRDQELDWIRETKEYLSEIYPDNMGGTFHPLFDTKVDGTDRSDGYGNVVAYYNSLYNLDGEVTIYGNCYHVELPFADARLYIMNVLSTEFDDNGLGNEYTCLEMYLVKDKVEPLCRTFDTRTEISNGIWRLYNTITEVYDNKGITKKARSILDHYMLEEDILDKDIPF